mgnify:FL=1
MKILIKHIVVMEDGAVLAVFESEIKIAVRR